MDPPDEIRPALNISKYEELNTEEFQNALYEYFENKGIISNLRTHLRTQMVNMLKETTLTKAIISHKPEVSPKVHAQNLLIAEYLLQRNYHYTLAVFSSEVPLSSTFPPVNLAGCKNSDQSFQFCRNDVCDILETLGHTRLDLGATLTRRYEKNNKDSLLSCILQNTANLVNEQNLAKQEDINFWLRKHDVGTVNLEAMISLLKTSGVNIDIILKICEQIKAAIINEVNNLNQLKDEQLEKLKKQMSVDAECRLHKYRDKISQLKAIYKERKQYLENELQETKLNLEKATFEVQEKYNNINELNDYIKGLETRLKQQEIALLSKEKSLQERQEYLEARQSHLDHQLEALKLASQSQSQIPAVKHVTGNTAIVEQNEDEMKSANQHPATYKIDDIGLQEENNYLRKISVEMQAQIFKLKDQNQSYQAKIKELLLRTNLLLVQLETRSHLRCRKTQVSPMQTGTEEAVLPSHDIYEHFHCEGINSDEETHVDEILVDAKIKLEKLEEESAVIDKHFLMLPNINQHILESNAASVIRNFQSNVSLLRESLTKIFIREPAISTMSDSCVYAKTLESNLPPCSADLKSMCQVTGDHMDDSTISSGMLINTSISTIEMSAD